LGPFDARPAEAGIAQPSGERCLAAAEYREGSIVETQRMGASGEVTIREVALRDGLQSEKMFVPTDQKRSLIRSLSQAGVEFMETTSFVSPKAIPQLRDAAELMAQVERGQMKHEVMVPNEKGARAALEAGADRLIVFVSASEAHNQANVRRSVAASLADLDAIFSLAREKDVPVAGAIAVAFGCPFQGRVPRTDVLEIARHFADLGADRISLADTTGLANPGQISDYVSFFTGQLPDTAFCLHLHNNRGVAMANLYAGYLAGITLFDTSLGGIGGCPNVPQAAGNLATEDVVFMFEEMGVATGLDLCRLIDAAKELEKMLDHPLPGQVMKSGPSGWHTTGAACGAA
jgi:hydroxymethylglutaryl-CoA lyase